MSRSFRRTIGVGAVVLVCFAVLAWFVLHARRGDDNGAAGVAYDRPTSQLASWEAAVGPAGIPLFRPSYLPPHSQSGTVTIRGVVGDRYRPVSVLYRSRLHIVESHQVVNPQLKDANEVVANADAAWSANVAGTDTLFVRRGDTLAFLTGRSKRELIRVAGSFQIVPRGARAALAATAFPPMKSGPTTYRNPVIHTDFADPTVLRASDGWYYAYSTEQLTVDRVAYIQAARSHDLMQWQLLPDVMPQRPRWASHERDFWAPGVIEAHGVYYLYFAAQPNTETGMCLGVAVSHRPTGPFHDSGRPLRCGEGFFNIDPMPFDDPVTGRCLLYWGSDHQPITVEELAPNRLRFAAGSHPTPLLYPNGLQPYEALVEAPWLTRHGDFYYLFFSGDNCCSNPANYAVMVARSRSATGPFKTRTDLGGTWGANVVIRMNDRWDGPGHNAVITDAAGHDWLVYHAIDRHQRFNPGTESPRRPMLMDRIQWRGGWPHIAGESPSQQGASTH